MDQNQNGNVDSLSSSQDSSIYLSGVSSAKKLPDLHRNKHFPIPGNFELHRDSDFITNLSPERNELAVETNQNIEIEFSDSIQVDSIDQNSLRVFGDIFGLYNGQISFSNDQKTLTFDPDRNFLAGEEITVVLTSGFSALNGNTLENGFSYRFHTQTFISSGTFGFNREILGFNSPTLIETGDFFNDGNEDFVVYNSSTKKINLWSLTANNTYFDTMGLTLGNFQHPYGIDIGDMNNNGILDFVLSNDYDFDDEVKVYEVSLMEDISLKSNTDVAPDPRGVTIADFNNDGYPDIATTNSSVDSLTIAYYERDNGGYLVYQNEIISTGNFPFSLTTGDYNSDGLMDIGVANRGDGTIAIFNNLGGGFSDPVVINVGNEPYDIISSDINSDNYMDLIVANRTSGNLTVFLNDSTGGFANSTTLPAGNQPVSIYSNDFDGDGDIDLACVNSSDNTVTIYLNYDGNLAPSDTIFTGNNPVKIVGIDSRSSGIIDLLVLNQGSNSVFLLENRVVGYCILNLSNPGIEEYSSDIVFEYSGYNTGDPYTYSAFYKPDSGSVWYAASIDGLISDPINDYTAGTFIWNSATDLPHVEARVDFKLLIENGEIIDEDIVTVPLDNNESPTVQIMDNFSGEQSDDLSLNYQLEDAENDTLGIRCEYFDPDSESWQLATVSGDTSYLTDYFGQLTWNSRSDLPSAYGNYLFRLTPFDHDPGWPDTANVFLDQLGLSVANSISQFTTEQSGDIIIDYLLNDDENDTLSISLDYSIDSGEHWSPATTTGSVTNILPSQYNGSITWNSAIDIAGLDKESVRLKLTPSDLHVGIPVETTDFHVDNNSVPTVQLEELTEIQTDSIYFTFILSDQEADTLSVELEFKYPDSTNWNHANVFSMVTGFDQSSYTGMIGWASYQDIPDYNGDVYVRIIPSDLDVGLPDTVIVSIDNIYTFIALNDYTMEQSNDVNIDYQIINSAGVPIGLFIEYSKNSGNSWSPATIIGDTTAIDTNSYSGTIIWKSFNDLPNYEGYTVKIKVTPRDTKPGFPSVTADFHLDNNIPPSIIITSLPETLSVTSDIGFTLSDNENDTIRLIGQYSLDHGQSWNEATLEGQTTQITASNYSGVLRWPIMHDIGFQRITSAQFQLLPFDLDPGLPDTVTGFAILNYPAEFTGDLIIDTDDLAIFATAWNSDPQDTTYDIGPATGTVPELVPVRDGILDFEDLAVFIQMWNWSFEYNGFHTPRVLAKYGSASPATLSFEIKEPQEQWSSTGITTIGIHTEKENLMQVECVIEYNGTTVSISSEEGDYFKTRYRTTPFLTHISSDSNRSSFCVVGLGPVDSNTKGTEIADIDLINHSASARPVTIFYRVWDTSGKVIESGQFTLDIQSFLPEDFSLQQNFPNPFNPNTTIRYALPVQTQVNISIYNIRGERVKTLIADTENAGYHQIIWDGNNGDQKAVSAGLYFYQIRAGNYVETKKMVMLK